MACDGHVIGELFFFLSLCEWQHSISSSFGDLGFMSTPTTTAKPRPTPTPVPDVAHLLHRATEALFKATKHVVRSSRRHGLR